MRKEEKPALFLFLLMQMYDFFSAPPKRAQLCRRLAKWGAGRGKVIREDKFLRAYCKMRYMRRVCEQKSLLVW